MSEAPSAVDLDDIQGIVRFAHGHMTASCFFLLRIADAAAARAWLAAVPVTCAASRHPPPNTAVQVCLTADGLRALGINDAVMTGFPPEFAAGMAGDVNRSRRLGDTPSEWGWGTGDRVPHVLVMVYAVPSRFDAWLDQIGAGTWGTAFTVIARLDTTDLGGREPFGFIDGISQPVLDWEGRLHPESTEDSFRNVLALGEFVLGYPNEYGKYTDRPLLDPASDPRALLPSAADVPARRDLGRNGSYLVFRDLRQDVDGFWQYLETQAASTSTTPRDLAEAMVGRKLEDGAPLPALSQTPIPGTEDASGLNGFVFDDDPTGARCPLGAHIHRANPRTSDIPPGTVGPLARLAQTLGLNRQAARDDLVAPARFHRILRRGREYGYVGGPGSPGRTAAAGLRFLCLNANIARQFEFVQSAWLMSTKFNGVATESDPLLGARAPILGCPVTDTFTWSRDGGVRRRLTGLPRFVTVEGGAYFFLPGIRALRWLASA